MGSSSSYGSPLPSRNSNGFLSLLPGAGDGITNDTFPWTPPPSNPNSDTYILQSFDWQQQSRVPLSGATHLQNRADLSLGQLLIMYPVVQALHNSQTEANLRISQALDTQAALVKENVRLSKENVRLSNELREVVANQRLDL